MIGNPKQFNKLNPAVLKDQGYIRTGKIFLLCLAFILFFLAGCAGTNRKVHIQHVGEYGTQFYQKNSKIELWTDLDLEFADQAELIYQIRFFQGGEPVAEVACNPMAVEDKQMHRYVEENGLVKVSYLGRMLCQVDLPEGETFVSVHFEAQADNLKIFRADLIIK